MFVILLFLKHVFLYIKTKKKLKKQKQLLCSVTEVQILLLKV